MWAYVDTSALVKRYIDEAGRRDVLQLLRQHDCVISAVLPADSWRHIPLRTLDAIHVASAQLFAARVTPSALIFVSADQRQTDAAAAVGLVAKHIA